MKEKGEWRKKMMSRIVDENGYPLDEELEEDDIDTKSEIYETIAELFGDLSRMFYKLAGYDDEP